MPRQVATATCQLTACAAATLQLAPAACAAGPPPLVTAPGPEGTAAAESPPGRHQGGNKGGVVRWQEQGGVVCIAASEAGSGVHCGTEGRHAMQMAWQDEIGHTARWAEWPDAAGSKPGPHASIPGMPLTSLNEKTTPH